jgi:hypothetical protein
VFPPHSSSSAAIIIIFGILTIMSVCLLVYGVKLIVRDCKSKRGWKWDSSKITAFWCVIGCVGIVFTTIGWWLATLAGSRWYYYALYQVFGLPLLIASLVFAVNTNGLMWIQIAKGAKKLAKGGANLQKKVCLRARVCSNVFCLKMTRAVFTCAHACPYAPKKASTCAGVFSLTTVPVMIGTKLTTDIVWQTALLSFPFPFLQANIFVYVFSIATFLIVIGLVFLGMATMTPGVIIICVWVTAPIYFIGGRGLSKAMKGNPNMKRVDDITRLVLQQGILFSILAVTIMVIFQIEDASNGGYKEPGTLILTFLVIAFMIFMSISMSFLLIQFVLDPKKKNAGDATKSRWWTRSTRRGGETGATGATSVTGSTETGSRTQTGFSASKVGGTTQGDTTKGGGDTTVGDATVGNELATLESGEQEVDLGKD